MLAKRITADRVEQQVPTFGGPWTETKLDILERYLDAYTTALKNTSFNLWYIDAFAGSGGVELRTDHLDDMRHFVSGSAERAIKIDDKPFDKLVFVEQDPTRCAQLASLQAANNHRNIAIKNSEANEYLVNLDDDWHVNRGVLFLDPFATEVKWSTLCRIASYNALDTWILFPLSAISRMLPRSKRPDDIAPGWVSRLTSVFGDESWRGLYHRRLQSDLFSPDAQERNQGTDELLKIYKGKLAGLFGSRFLQQSRTLRNSKNSPLFEFLFCAGNPGGTKIAKRIARHLVEKL